MKKSTFYIVGRHAVTAALKNPKRRVLRVFLTEESKKDIHRNSQNQNLLKNIKIYFKTKKELDKYCAREGIMHQGFVAEVEHLETINLKDFVDHNVNKNNVNLVALDGITDPRNIGSIIRSAASFNIDGIIVKERSFPIESKLLYKSASGCTELVDIFEVTNLNTSLKYLKSKNFWISGFDSDGGKDFIKNDWKGKNVLLFGSEGEGLKFQIKKNADFLFRIDVDKKVESLNVSNSASIVFHHINQKIHQK
ncbi:MAG: 23S rRNA (guanosine(2251)-2'-O)-methyltransferase RlmB [Candidatus Pelagibacter sp. TMED196]|nr:MAG: 23S rRNA (guanosine(2251)-2'-O)-methyltransferase RlmB [Candidatus Pelagibacter sp. TMED196]